jgi:hypothetical protein
MFQNANFNTKWFYAFITKIEWVNVNECTVFYEMDIFQSWQFDFTLKPSFVEREHTNDDTFGSNLVSENLELGDYVSGDVDFSGVMSDVKIVVATTADLNGQPAVGGMYCGIYSGLLYLSFDNYTDVNTYINNMTVDNKMDAIIAIFQMPSYFVGNVGDLPKLANLFKDKSLTVIDGYTPKNKKLFTHPYNFLYVSNLNGNSAEYPYEYFNSDTCSFDIQGDMSANPSIMLTPLHYKGALKNYNEKIVIDGFPQCAYTTDTFKAWLAQNGASTAVSVMSSAFGVGASLATGNIGGVVGSISSIGQTIAKVGATMSLPRQAHGATGGSALFAFGLKDFAFMNMHIRAEYAKIIDEYFSMYGYATHRVKVPNVKGRPSWNYVKTIDCKLTGNVPFNDLAKIKSIFNSGVTFWHGDYVGDYSRNNQI